MGPCGGGYFSLSFLPATSLSRSHILEGLFELARGPFKGPQPRAMLLDFKIIHGHCGCVVQGPRISKSNLVCHVINVAG